MNFIEITKSINLDYIKTVSSNSTLDVKDITLSSKEADESMIFTAIKGFKTDGHKFIADAYKRGCRNFFIEHGRSVEPEIENNSSIISTGDTRTALALASNFINGYPFDRLNMIGITGTKGKTTTTTLLHKFLSINFKSGMFSTIKNIVGGKTTDSERTTMEADRLQKLLRQSADCGETHSVVEVSSHAVTLKRVEGINWDAGVFTTFSRDHLDLYGTMKNYFQAKLDFFKALNGSQKKNKFAIINIDDPKGNEVVDVIDGSIRLIRVGKGNEADFKIENIRTADFGQTFSVSYKGKRYEFETKMPGIFNITNVSLAVAAAMELGIKPDEIIKSLADFSGVEGRFEIVIDKPFTVIVDYAHTPDSLEKILTEARLISKGKVISVFGCTGDRDRDKRSIMGSISAKNADYTIVTNDDTYTEDPETIAAAVESGLKDMSKKQEDDYKLIYDRHEAIREAMAMARPGDVIVIAGMGHEKYQYIGDTPVSYNDKETVLKLASDMSIT
jgi:UDP-N-acetylmuramoyl-L-alanyl-D-glutamate--2,6-diaminopimelate ligase